MADRKTIDPKDLERIKRFTLMHDVFMSKVFEDKKCVELLLSIILKKKLTVIKVISQCTVKNLQGRSVRLDIYAVDSDNIHYNIEIQNLSKGANPKRARYNSALMDANIIQTGDDLENLPESYVIFITEKDVFKGNKPLYTIERKIGEMDNALFEDEAHIIYVNGKCRNDTELGRLMHDFFCTEPEEMYNKLLADRVDWFKNQKEGVDSMCDIMEEIRQETEMKTLRKSKIEIAMNLIAKKKLDLEDIAEATGLSLEEVNELSVKKSS